jgi:hypothetical protein
VLILTILATTLLLMDYLGGGRSRNTFKYRGYYVEIENPYTNLMNLNFDGANDYISEYEPYTDVFYSSTTVIIDRYETYTILTTLMILTDSMKYLKGRVGKAGSLKKILSCMKIMMKIT